MSSNGLIALAAGGTGGHLFPAQALAEVLVRRGYTVQLVTDERVRDYGKSFPAEKVHLVGAATLSLSDPIKLPLHAFKLLRGFVQARSILRREAPKAVVGFGGYPSFAPLRAASSLGIPVIVHEQNSVLGRANAALASRAQVIAGSFSQIRNLDDQFRSRYIFVGNPVRAVVLAQMHAAYPSFDPINLVVFGGSQGARFFSDFMPGVFGLLSDDLRRNLSVVQQCRPEDIERTKTAYLKLGLCAELQPFFGDMPQRLAAAHLVVSRSGASTIAELGVIGRPAMLVPLPGAIDNDQFYNAKSFADAGAGWVFPQTGLNDVAFASRLQDLLMDRAELVKAAKSAKSHGKPDASDSLADVVERVIAGRRP